MEGLQLPCSIAVQSAANSATEVYVADRAIGRVAKASSRKANDASDVITGFPKNDTAADKPNAAGIQSILFVAPKQMVVVGGNNDGKPFVHLYELPDSGEALQFGKQQQSAQLAAEHGQIDEGIRSFHDLVRTRPNDRVPDALLTAGENEHGPAGIWKIAIRANTIERAVPFDAGSNHKPSTAVSAIAVSASGYVAIAARTTDDAAHRNVLKFLSPADGRILLEVPTDLENIVGLAYSPSSGNLYAANIAADDPSNDGIYLLIDAGTSGQPGCKTTKVANLARPTALAFGPDAALYVTALGPATPPSSSSGKLYKLTGDL